ncbi:MAG: SpoIIE family protein phosphatase [bacterium]|nr:MAG: SpoIIE family protein phosphatase [bacterium]
MADAPGLPIRDQLIDRRSKLKTILTTSPNDPLLLRLLREVDAALTRINDGTYGLCKTCEECIEPERLIADPLAQYCLDHLTPDEQRALEQDLERASSIQAALLPPQNLEVMGWKTHYYYKGAGPVSGDYCDLLEYNNDLYIMVGDVSGKGIAASMLMTHLYATFRSLVTLELPLEELVGRASRMFCQSTLPTHFATLICGKADNTGKVKICNAGHHPPLLIRRSKIETVKATGLPLGMFCEERFTLSEEKLDSGDTLFLYTDGLVEAQNTSGHEYGKEQLLEIVSENCSLPPEKLVSACIESLNTFLAGAPRTDDLTIMAIRKL